MKKNKDIEKYINESIKSEMSEKLSKERIVSALENEEIQYVKYKDRTIRRFYKAVAVAAAFAIVIGGVSIFNNKRKIYNYPAPTYETGEVVSAENYDDLYSALGEMRKAYLAERKKNNNLFSAAISGASATDKAPDSAINSANECIDEEDVNFGNTNTQEKGVDEGDRIKTDGKNIYIVNGENCSVRIIKADNGEMKEFSRLDFTPESENYHNSIREIYLSDGKLTVIYTEYDYGKEVKYPIVFNGIAEVAADMAYSYACCCPVNWMCMKTHINIYDVSNPENPKTIKEFSQSGDYVSSRMTDGKLYAVTSYGVNISDKDYKDECIPKTVENGEEELVSAENITIVKGNNNPSYAVISTLDVKGEGKSETSAIFGDATYVYATKESLYVVEQKFDNENCIPYLNAVRFKFTDTGVKYVASARADGSINDNLSMSEYGGHFRIATTCNIFKKVKDGGRVFIGETNKLYIFDGDMKLTGTIDSFAKDEQIRSVRYMGDYAYIVTFRQTDPLFVINLSDPANPKIEGKLKLPGFSNYLHPVGDGLLVGVGYDGDEENSNGNMKVSLFSISDPENPEELSKLLVGDDFYYVTSNLNDSYKAFMELPNGEFAIPFALYSDDGNNGTNMYIRYKVENGELTEIARFKLANSYYGGIECGTYIGDYLYAFSFSYHYSESEERDIYKYTVTSFNLKTNEKANEITLK